MLRRPEGPRQTSTEEGLSGRNIRAGLVGNLGIEAFQRLCIFLQIKKATLALKLFAVKRKKSNDFLADKIKCMVNRISNETQKK